MLANNLAKYTHTEHTKTHKYTRINWQLNSSDHNLEAKYDEKWTSHEQFT